MQAVGNNVLVAVDMNQKSDGAIEFEGVKDKIYINHDFGFDLKVSKPSLARVVQSDIEGLKKDDVILCHHNSFSREINYDEGEYFGDTGIKQGKLSIFRLEYGMIYAKLDEKGNPHPLKDYILVERIEQKISTRLIIADSVKKTDPNMFRVVKGCEGIEDGIEVVCYVYSDYKIEYSWNYKERSVIRVKKEDVLLKKNNMKLEGINESLLVKADDPVRKTAGGIIIADTVDLKPNTGTVVVADEGTADKPMRIKEGFKVLFNKGAGQKVQIEEEDFLILKQSEILFFDRKPVVA